MCGEKRKTGAVPAPLPGSPPRVRGKDGVNDSAQAVTGITPAYAGKSHPRRSAQGRLRDHPRVCGEKTEYRALVTAHQGSPPRMRGKGVIHVFVAEKFRITPAYAGKSYSGSFSFFTPSDHPRVCGEKTASQVVGLIDRGSPPRMRGKVFGRISGSVCHGITPAYAGKSSTATLAAHSTGDHPRVCGEKVTYTSL